MSKFRKQISRFRETPAIVAIALCFTFGNASAELRSDIVNVPFQVVIPIGIGVIQGNISPNASDPSIIFRITALSSNAWFDAIAPYNEKARGVYSHIPNRPESERTDENRNVAMLYASLRVLNSILPDYTAVWEQMVSDAGLDPFDLSLDLSTPVGIGNHAGFKIAEARENDGTNQLGNEGGCVYNCVPYSDYTGYAPLNTYDMLIDASRWQPKLLEKPDGTSSVQAFVTPYLEKVVPYSYKRPNRFKAPYPVNSDVNNIHGYADQANVVLQASADLTDEQKIKSELFDNKFESVLAAAGSAVPFLGLTLEEAVIIEFATNIASFDTAIAIWYNKRKYDAVRPFSAIAHIYGSNMVTAWGGVGNGTVYDMPADQWESYLPVANHPEYPSATASFCTAHAQVMRKLHGEYSINFTYNIEAGGSRIEPGITPSTDLSLSWTNWTDFENDCGQSRLWAGVHFPDSIPAGMDIGRRIANKTVRMTKRLLRGKAVVVNK